MFFPGSRLASLGLRLTLRSLRSLAKCLRRRVSLAPGTRSQSSLRSRSAYTAYSALAARPSGAVAPGCVAP